MRQQLRGTGRWLLGLAVLVTSAVTARAQATSGMQDGAFVQAPDGSMWVVSHGRRVGIAAMPDETGLLGTLQEGSSAATVGELNAALAAFDPATTPPPPLMDYTFTTMEQSPRFSASGPVDVCWEFAPP